MKREWGCEKDIAEFTFFDEKLTRCPLRGMLEMPDLVTDVIRHFKWLEKGLMPIQGGWIDQSMAWVVMMEEMTIVRNQIDKWHVDKNS